MGLLSWIVFGLIAGILAKVVMPGRDPGGVIVTIVIGIAGAVIGGFIATLLGFGDIGGFNLPNLLFAVLGGVVVVLVYRQLRR